MSGRYATLSEERQQTMGSRSERRQAQRQQRRWGPIRIIRKGLGATAQGLSRAVRVPANRLRRNSPIPSAGSNAALVEPGNVSLGASLQNHVDKIATGVAGSLAWIIPQQQQNQQPLEAKQREAAAEQSKRLASRYAFPSHVTEGMSTRELAATGSRTWGSWWDGRGLLNLKIYDFAIYVDGSTAKQSRLARRYQNKPLSKLQKEYYSSLRSSKDIGMSLVVRTNHPLPIGIMAREYERILRKRITVVGGNEEDPNLHQMLEYFKEPNLPNHVKWGRNTVRKGTVLAFHRTEGGGLSASANDELLGSVPSHHVASALFDLYLGDNPVNGKAKRSAGRHVHGLISDSAPSVKALDQQPASACAV